MLPLTIIACAAVHTPRISDFKFDDCADAQTPGEARVPYLHGEEKQRSVPRHVVDEGWTEAGWIFHGANIPSASSRASLREQDVLFKSCMASTMYRGTGVAFLGQ